MKISKAHITTRQAHSPSRSNYRLFQRPIGAAFVVLLSGSSSQPAFCFSSSSSSTFSSTAPPFGLRTSERAPHLSKKSSSCCWHSQIAGTSSLPFYATLPRGGAGSSCLPSSLTRSQLSASSSTITTETTSTTTESVSNTDSPQQQPKKENKIMIQSRLTPSERLDALRTKMKELELDVYLVPSDDPHLSEYVPAAYMRRAFLSGFQGSAGTALVTTAPSEQDSATPEKAYLWTDSRYWNEAGLQLDPNCWTLQKAGLPTTKTISKWLAERAVQHYQTHGKPLKVGMDPFVNAASFAKEIEDAFTEAAAQEFADDGVEGDSVAAITSTIIIGVLETQHGNLIDPIWGDERPPIPTSPFRVHPLEYAGMSVADKVSKVRKEMQDKKATMSVFSTLDDVAYLFNVRSKGDVDTCPVGIAYASVTMDDVRLYCDPQKLTDEVREHLAEVTLLPYEAVIQDIQAHCQTKGNKVWMDKSRTNYGLIRLVPEKMLVDSKTAVTDMKAAKNAAEMEGMRQAHIVDGVAMAKFMSWLEHTIVQEGRKVSEVEVDEKLTGCRAEQPGFVEVSFPTIAGVGPNGAIIHYRASEDSDIMRYLDTENPILIDSGGQYTYGTTDVTRSWHFGTPTPEYVDAYTRVLKGHIGLDEMIFPENTPGFALDIYARRWLWDGGKDYGHGTGHGVGAALNVHEGPMSISPRWGNKEGLKAGMVVSNEPGYYEDGNFGIRIENLLEIQYVNPEDAEEKPEGEDNSASAGKKKFLHFKKLTMIPIQKNLIEISLMTSRELDWLDAYHQEVFEKVSPLLEPDSPAMVWLTKSCEKIDRQ